MTYKKKSAIEKLHESHGLPKVEKITGKISKKWGEGTVVIPTPIEVNKLIAKVPKGKVTTINEIRAALAKKHKATIGCPWWRTLKSNGELNEKYPGGAENQKKLLEQESHQTIKKGKNYFVADWEKSLFTGL